MLDKLGLIGVAGVLVLLGGLGLLAVVDPLVAAGVTLVVAGLGLVAAGLVKSMLGAFGLGI